MSGIVSEYELEALPELSAGYESELEGDRESEQFFGALANLARRGAGWLTAPGSPQRQAALTLARQAINRGVPALGRWRGGQTASWLGGLLPQQEYEWESELEISPIRKIYPDAMMEHLGHAAAEAHGEAEAESLAGAMIPLAARVVPQAAPTLMRAMPGLVSGVAGVVRRLHRDPCTRPLVRVVPAIVRGTAANIAQNAARGVEVTPQAAVRALAQQTLRCLEARRPVLGLSGVRGSWTGSSTAEPVSASRPELMVPVLPAARECGRRPWTTCQSMCLSPTPRLAPRHSGNRRRPGCRRRS